MGKTLHLLSGEERQEALSSLERLDDDFSYPLKLDGSIPEQTERDIKEIEEERLDNELTDLYLHHRELQRLNKYYRFLMDIGNLRISLRLSKNSNEKRELLKIYFPRRYEKQGMGWYSAEKLGKTFLGFLDYARKLKRN